MHVSEYADARVERLVLRPLGSVDAANRPAHTSMFRNAYALIGSAASTSALGVLYWILAAHLYGADVVGRNSAAITAMLFLSSISALELHGAVIRFAPRVGAGARRLILVTYAIAASVALLLGALFLAGIRTLSPALGFLLATPQSAALFLFATVTGCIFMMQDGVLTGLQRTRWVLIENTAFAASKILLLVLLAGSVPDTGVFASWIIPAALMIVPISYFVFGRVLREDDRAPADSSPSVPASEIVRYTAGNYAAFLFLQGCTRLLPLLVIALSGSRSAAYFYVPWSMVTSLQLIAQNMGTSLVLEGSIDDRHVDWHARGAFVQTLRLVAPASGALLLAAPMVLRLFGADYASEGSTLLRLLALGLVPNTCVALFISMCRVRGRTLPIILAQAATALVTLGGAYVLIPRYGIAGVGFSWLAAQIVVSTPILLRVRFSLGSTEANHRLVRGVALPSAGIGNET